MKNNIKSVFSSVDNYGEVYINLDKILKEMNNILISNEELLIINWLIQLVLILI